MTTNKIQAEIEKEIECIQEKIIEQLLNEEEKRSEEDRKKINDRYSGYFVSEAIRRTYFICKEELDAQEAKIKCLLEEHETFCKYKEKLQSQEKSHKEFVEKLRSELRLLRIYDTWDELIKEQIKIIDRLEAERRTNDNNSY